MKKYEIILAKKGYIVSEDGIFYNPKKEILNYTINGYISTCIRVNGHKINVKAHRLQAYQKYGDKLYEPGILVRHLDGNPSNNCWENILIGTNSDNMMDIPSQIRIKKSLHATSFVRKYNKKEIKEYHEIEKSYKNTMEKFNITSKGTLNYILNN